MFSTLEQMRPLAYYAAPLFSEGELQFNQRVVDGLEKYIDVFLPQRDGGKLTDLLASGVPRAAAYRSIFDRDIESIRSSNVLIIVLDGRAVDEGAAFELGYAHALGKVCVALETDPRRLFPAGHNPMIEVPLHKVFRSVQSLVTWASSLVRRPATLE